MDIIGRIHFQNKVFVNKQECYGVVKADGNKFKILIAKCAGGGFDLFAETLLHELLHLWVFILMALTDINVSEKRQHKIIGTIMPKAIKGIKKYRED